MIDFFINPFTQTVLAFLIPILLLPLFMRFFVSRILLFSVKKKYLPGYLRKLVTGWEGGNDKKALAQVSDYALERMKYHFVFKPDIVTDMKAILLCIKGIYEPVKGSIEPCVSQPEALFSFSIAGMAECALLAFSDIYREYGETSWFRAIRNLKLVWFFRFRRLLKFYRVIFSNPIFEQLKKFRLAGKILRILLIPVLGLPEVIVYAIRSISIGIFMEGFFRFFYGLLILKFGYYALYLYGKKNTHIKKRITSIPEKKLKEMNDLIQKMILPSGWEEKSESYPGAVAAYLLQLKNAGIAPDTEMDDSERSLLGKTKKAVGGFFNRMGRSMERLYRKHNPFSGKIDPGLAEILELIHVVSRAYDPKPGPSFAQLRIGELIMAGYMASVIVFHKIFSTPGLKLVLDKIPLSFALTLSKAMKTDAVKAGVTTVKEVYKYYRLFRLGCRTFRIVRGIASPLTLVWTLANPIIFQQIRDMLYEYITHRAGRLSLFTWESSILKKKNSLTPILW